MPRKASKAAKADEEPSAEAQEHTRLQDAAFDLGAPISASMTLQVLSRTRRLCGNPLPPTRLMERAAGKDIVKKSSVRKGRYLLVLNFQLAPAAAGKLGMLAALDSQNPVLYLDFPQGRYKLLGTLVFPRNKYVVLRMGQREVLCEDVLEGMIVFSEGWWVGRAEDNPEEARLPDPDWLAQPPLHSKFDFSTRGTATAAAGGGGKEAEGGEEEEEGEEDEAGPASQRPQRRASRAAGGKKRLRYNEDSDGDEGEDDEEDDSEAEERAPRKLQRVGSQQQRAARKAQAKQQPESHPIDLVGNGSSSGEDSESLAARAGKQAGTLDAFVKRAPAAAPKSGGKGGAAPKRKPDAKKRQAAEAAEEEDEIIDLASSEDEGAEDAPPSSARPRSQRRAASAAAKKLRVEDEDEDEGAGEGSDAGDATEEASDDEADGGSGGEEEEDGEGSEGSEASSDEASDYEPSE